MVKIWSSRFFSQFVFQLVNLLTAEIFNPETLLSKTIQKLMY